MFLLAASYSFYMAWKPEYLLVIIALTVFDYFAGMAIEGASGARQRKAIWLGSLAANLSALFVFKYLGFFTREWNHIASWLSVGGELPVVDLLLPIGISFHTFQAISYTTDVFQRTQKAEHNLLQFALFISWFPQMVAGPIERAHSLQPQLREFNLPSAQEIRIALSWIFRGTFKKVVIASNLASCSALGFASPGAQEPWLSVLAIYAFSFQIYCDFSGYTDIARGCSLLFGVRLSVNFDHPYLSMSFPEFWRRWHISLSTWFFEYVYQPLVRRYPEGAGPWLALFAVFALSGIWHGANLTFLVWGLLNGVICALYMLLFRVMRLPESTPARIALVLVNFHLVCLCWVFFRSPTLASAVAMLSDVGTFLTKPNFGGDLPVNFIVQRTAFGAFGLALLGIAFPFREAVGKWVSRSWLSASFVFLLITFLILELGLFDSDTFIYFNF